MSRRDQLEGLENRLPDMSADELQTTIKVWRTHLRGLRGPGLKLGRKFLHRLERTLELKSRTED